MTTSDATIGVVGLGYVGLPLAISLAEAGFEVVGIDANDGSRADVGAGLSPIDDIDNARLGRRWQADSRSLCRPRR